MAVLVLNSKTSESKFKPNPVSWKSNYPPKSRFRLYEKKILQYLFEHKTLSREAAKEVLVSIGKGQYNEHEVTAFMTVYLMRSITIDELQGFRDALLELCVKADLSEFETMDIVAPVVM